MSAFGAMVWNGYREARRNRITTLIGGFAIVLMASSTLVAEVTVMTFQRVSTDVGLGLMAMIMTVLAIYLACGMLPGEIERRTIFLVVSRPISRATFLVARLIGNVLTLAILLAAMTAIFWLQSKYIIFDIGWPVLYAQLGLLTELVVLSAAGFMFSSMSSAVVSATCTTGLYFMGHLTNDLYKIADRSDSAAMKAFGRFIYYALPNLENLNYRGHATYDISVDPADFLKTVVYALGYAVVFTVVAMFVFERRDFK